MMRLRKKGFPLQERKTRSFRPHRPTQAGAIPAFGSTCSSGRYRARTCDLQRVMKSSPAHETHRKRLISSSLSPRVAVARSFIVLRFLLRNRGRRGASLEDSTMHERAPAGRECPRTRGGSDGTVRASKLRQRGAGLRQWGVWRDAVAVACRTIPAAFADCRSPLHHVAFNLSKGKVTGWRHG
jgi:hypothetical protein